VINLQGNVILIRKAGAVLVAEFSRALRYSFCSKFRSKDEIKKAKSCRFDPV